MDLKKPKKENLSNLFVYGTLQTGQSRNYILKCLKFEKATLFKFRKVQPTSLGFPLIIRDNTSNVRGEIYYDLDHFLLTQIDMIEGEGELYNRIMVNIALDDGKEVEAFTYYPSESLITKYT